MCESSSLFVILWLCLFSFCGACVAFAVYICKSANAGSSGSSLTAIAMIRVSCKITIPFYIFIICLYRHVSVPISSPTGCINWLELSKQMPQAEWLKHGNVISSQLLMVEIQNSTCLSADDMVSFVCFSHDLPA